MRPMSPLALFLSLSGVACGISYDQCPVTPTAPTCRNHVKISDKIPTRGDRYLIGVGKADITGPVVELGLAGYGKFNQPGTGLRQRLYSRAFIVADIEHPENRIAYLVLDDLSGDTAVRYGLLEALADAGDEYGVYTQHNVALTATHSHAGPGGWFNYFLPQTTTFGFDKQSYQAIVDGASLSIKRAHESLEEGYLDVGTTELTDASINRSLFAYLNNPEAERAEYNSSVDTTMTVLRLQRASDNRNIGIFNWFATHGTSLYNNNTHVAGDNKGVAAWMFEQAIRDDGSAAEGFVAGFSQANSGDASPNTLGAWCEDGSHTMCNLKDSSCPDGTTESCRGRGPLFRELDNGVKSCYEIGSRQFLAAKRVYDSLDLSPAPITGSVKAFHFFHDMAYWNFSLPNGTEVTTCPAALGYAFAAGTSDGPGVPGFTQATSHEPIRTMQSRLWAFFFGLFSTPSTRQKDCHWPKPIIVDAGGISLPHPWEPNAIDVQVLRIGQIIIALSPSEITTMSGRRWRNAIAKEASKIFDEVPIPLVVGPANTYAHYVTTSEEYQTQRYEGASTIFGPHQLAAYINLTTSNMHYLESSSIMSPKQVIRGYDSRKRSISLFPGVWLDGTPAGTRFGSVVEQPLPAYKLGETVKATFHAANPRNNLRLEGTFIAVERQDGNGRWEHIVDDADWFLIYTWRRTNFLRGHSEVDISWETYGNAVPGKYRFKYYGDARQLFGLVKSFEGISRSFRLD